MRLPRTSLIGIAAGLGVVVVAAGAYFAGVATAPKQAEAAHAPAEAQAERVLAAPGPVYIVKERVVNLADAGGRRYLKVSLSIEFTLHAAEFKKANPEERKVKQAEFDKMIAPQAPMIEDAVIALLSAKTSADIVTAEGKAKLKQEMKETLNRILGGDHVANIYFTQFVTQ